MSFRNGSLHILGVTIGNRIAKFIPSAKHNRCFTGICLIGYRVDDICFIIDVIASYHGSIKSESGGGEVVCSLKFLE